MALGLGCVVALSTCAPRPSTDGYTGPLVIRTGGTYSGSWESRNPNVAAVTIRTSQPVVIENARLLGGGDLIKTDFGRYAHVTVRNVQGASHEPAPAGRPPGRFLHADTYAHVHVERSSMEGTAGIYLHRARPGASVTIVGNRARNVDGRHADGLGGHRGNTFVQFLQINDAEGLRGAEIAWNEIVNVPYQSRVEDVISLYRTSGSVGDPVRVHDNYIQGAYPADPASDEYSGGGIMLGDGGGAHLHATQNQVVGTSNYGIAISGGRSNRIDDNRVISCGLLPDGRPIASQNVGIYIWNIGADGSFADNGGSGNLVAWSSASGDRNDWWVPDAASWHDNRSLLPDETVPCEVEAAEYERWREKLAAADVEIGAPLPR